MYAEWKMVESLKGSLVLGSSPVGRPKLRFRDVCKRDMLATGLPANNWELLAEDRVKWKTPCSQALRAGERKLKAEADIKRTKRKEAARVAASVPAESEYICRAYPSRPEDLWLPSLWGRR